MPTITPTPLAPAESLDTDSIHDKKATYALNTLAQDAQEATTKEQKMTLREGLKMYPNAIMWSVIISTCIAMEGYDLCLLGNFCKLFVRGVVRKPKLTPRRCIPAIQQAIRSVGPGWDIPGTRPMAIRS